MKTNLFRIAVSLGLTAVAAALLALVSINIDTVVGYGAVVALLAGAAVEYRLSRRSVFGR